MSERNEVDVRRKVIGCRGKYEVLLGSPELALMSTRFSVSLYNNEKHLATQQPGRVQSVALWNTETLQTEVLLHVAPDHGTLSSLPNAPFGSLEFQQGTSTDLLVFLVECLEKWAPDHALTQFCIKMPPAAYDPTQFSTSREVYQRCGFARLHAYTNHHIPVTSRPFVAGIHASERKRLQKCLRAGFVAEPWHRPDPEQVYAFVAESRRRQGYVLNLRFAQLRQLLQDFPDEARVFVVRDGQEIASLTVAIRVNDRILYNFCPADHLEYRSYSPAVLLNAALYAYAQSEGIELIDLGISLDHFGIEKKSLIRFKENLGGQPSVKEVYTKNIGKASAQ